MNSENSNVQPPQKLDKSLLDILSAMSKTVVSEAGNQMYNASSTSNNLNARQYGNQNSNPPEKLIWGRTYETNTPQVTVKPEHELKKEGDDQDELSKMIRILQGESPSKPSQPHSVTNQAVPKQTAPAVASVKDEIKAEVSDKQQSFTLIEQREAYVKKVAKLQTKIDMLKQRRQELRGDGIRSPSPESKALLKENTKLQLLHQNKVKNINSLIGMLNGILGETAKETVTPEQPAVQEIKPSPPKRFNYVFYDSELHWCRVCNVFPPTATDYLNHLHSQDHKSKVATAYMEAPWHAVATDDGFPTHPLVDTKRMPIKGLQFFVPATAWYCKLCDQFAGDLHCASAHLRSVTHSKNYSVFVKENPHWEADWMLDRQKASEEMRLTVSLEEVDSFNIESISGKEKEKEKGEKKKKYPRSPSSSDGEIPDSPVKASVKREKINGQAGDKSYAKRLDPLITDRKLLDEINSIKIPNSHSPPRSYRQESRRDEDTNGYRRKSRFEKYVSPDRQPDDRRSVLREKHLRQQNRSSRVRDTGSSERRRLRSPDRRSERERSEVRSRSRVRDRSPGSRRSERDRSDRDRSEARRDRRRSPSVIDLSDEMDKKNQVIGKIPPFKITSIKKEDSKVLEKESSRQRKENMDVEIQKKVDEFKAHLFRMQGEMQQKSASLQPAALPKPTAPPLQSTFVRGTPLVTVPAPAAHPPAYLQPTHHTPTTSDLDMNQVVEMASQILHQQAMMGLQDPYAMDPMMMPMGMPPMGGSILGPPPAMPMGMQPPMLGVRPFMPRFPLSSGLSITPKGRNRNRNQSNKRKPQQPTTSKPIEKKTEDIYPPGEEKSEEIK